MGQAQALTVITRKAKEEEKKAGEALSKAKTAEKTQKGITKAGDEKAQDDAVKKVKDAKDAEAKSKTDLKAKRKSLKETPLHCITLKGISKKMEEKAKEELKACKNDFEVVEKDMSKERAAKLRETQHAEVMQKLKAKIELGEKAQAAKAKEREHFNKLSEAKAKKHKKKIIEFRVK